MNRFKVTWDNVNRCRVLEFNCLKKFSGVSPKGDKQYFLEFYLTNGRIQGINGMDNGVYMMNLVNDMITIAETDGHEVVEKTTLEECNKAIKDALEIKWLLI